MIDVREYLRNKIEYYLEGQGTIIIIKGIDINLTSYKIYIDMEEIIDNKFNYFLKLMQSERRVLIYDEYLALYELILMQFKKIIILENNIFINYYPLQTKLSKEKLDNLLNHYNENIEGEQYEIGDVQELTLIYGSIMLINDTYYITYNNITTDEKEEIFPIFSKELSDIKKIAMEYSDICYEIISEEDYVLMVDNILNGNNEKIFIVEKNTNFSKLLTEEKLKVLKYIWQDDIKFSLVQLIEKKNKIAVRSEFLEILKKYWGHDNFRKIKVYNLNKLICKEKVVEEILQSEIITNIVEETEKCIQRKDYRDIFVTAPTGAGKSAIFQIPAIYLANSQYELFTIVISPLIGLMKDQVINLELHNYNYARTINSDISPIQKQEIINDIMDKKCHILYLSPESLLSKSDLDQIIGSRILGLLVIDEAHIVTTWGKQFRPDYWYLGDHLNKMKKSQIEKKGMGFVIATFTATAIYGGIENMYEETIESLKMVDPITYLGYVKRENIRINVQNTELITGKTEYELNKFDQLIEKIDYSLMLDKKMLVYFPTVALINRFWEYCIIKNFGKYISRYHGKLSGYEKEENYMKFLNKETPIMLATKAFGMGIDIDDIEIVAHFSPTGNVCDYVQEIGRAARRSELEGEAFYKFMKNDFKHINRLHGLSVVKEYQLIEVIHKIYELYQENIKNNKGKKITKKRNEMLVDAESFAHIFENPFFNEDDGINKVKTAMLLIQKDFERRFSFSPFHVRPIPLFEVGFFEIDTNTQKNITGKYGLVLQQIDNKKFICSVNLKKIWEHSYNSKYSFPKFKYMLYTKDSELSFEYKNNIKPALNINIVFGSNYLQNYTAYLSAIKAIVNKSIREEKFYDVDGEDGLISELMKLMSISTYKAKSIIDTMLSAMSVYQRDYSKSMYGKIYIAKALKSGEVKYKFMNGATSFFKWIESGFNNILENVTEGTLYLIDETGNKGFKENLLILGVLETLDILVFKALGGANSQLYIYVNQTKTMKEIIEKPWRYKNRLLEIVSERHEISVEMLTYLFESKFSSEEIWGFIEDYFLGIIPEDVVRNYEEKTGKKLYLA